MVYIKILFEPQEPQVLVGGAFGRWWKSGVGIAECVVRSQDLVRRGGALGAWPGRVHPLPSLLPDCCEDPAFLP